MNQSLLKQREAKQVIQTHISLVQRSIVNKQKGSNTVSFKISSKDLFGGHKKLKCTLLKITANDGRIFRRTVPLRCSPAGLNYECTLSFSDELDLSW